VRRVRERQRGPARRVVLVGAVVAVSVLGVTGCSGAAPRPAATATADSCAGAPGDVLQDFADAFNEHDASALAALFSSDATFINIYGQVMEGRTGIENGHQRAFDSRLVVADLVVKEVDEEELGSDQSLLYGYWDLAQPANADASASVPPGSGILTAIAHCTAEGWELRAATNVRETPPPS
jgi:uncharacterized protein (TIGR02246 family)